MTEIMPVPRILILLSYQQGTLRLSFFVRCGHCPDFGTHPLISWVQRGKEPCAPDESARQTEEGSHMTAISVICTMCGAAALSRGILKAIEYIGR